MIKLLRSFFTFLIFCLIILCLICWGIYYASNPSTPYYVITLGKGVAVKREDLVFFLCWFLSYYVVDFLLAISILLTIICLLRLFISPEEWEWAVFFSVVSWGLFLLISSILYLYGVETTGSFFCDIVEIVLEYYLKER